MYNIIIVFRYTTTTVNVYVIASHINLDGNGGTAYQLPVYAQIVSRRRCSTLRFPIREHRSIGVWTLKYSMVVFIFCSSRISMVSRKHNIPSVSPARVHRMPECLSSALPNVFIIIIFHRAPSKTLLVVYCTAIWVGAIQRNIHPLRNTVFQWSYKRTLTVHFIFPSYTSATGKFSFTSFSSIS